MLSPDELAMFPAQARFFFRRETPAMVVRYIYIRGVAMYKAHAQGPKAPFDLLAIAPPEPSFIEEPAFRYCVRIHRHAEAMPKEPASAASGDVQLLQDAVNPFQPVLLQEPAIVIVGDGQAGECRAI